MNIAMEETKICPNCGREVLAIARKCKHCGYWMAPKETMHCPICQEVIPKDSEICPMCHERLREADQTEEVTEDKTNNLTDSDSVSEPSSSNPVIIDATPVDELPQHDNNGKKKKTILIASIAAGVIVLLGLFLLFRHNSGGTSDKFAEAEQLHSFFFKSLCMPIPSLADNEILQKRLSKLLSKQQYQFIEENLSLCSPVYLKYDEAGNAIFSFFGTKNSSTIPETYTVNYTDVGGKYGWFDVITLIDGNRKQSKESVKKVTAAEEITPTIRVLQYEGTVSRKGQKKDIAFTFYVDGPGEQNEPIRGFYQESGNPSNVPVWGLFKMVGNSTMFLYSQGDYKDFDLSFNPSFVQENDIYSSIDLALCLEGSCDEPKAVFKLYKIGNNSPIPDHIKYVAYEGKLYDEKSAYPIELHLATDLESEVVSGYYFYKSKGQENFIPLGGLVSHGNSYTPADYLDLETVSGNENFSFEVVGSWDWDVKSLSGDWTRYDDNTYNVNRELKIALTAIPIK